MTTTNTSYSLTIHLRAGEEVRIESDYLTRDETGTDGFAVLKIEDLTIFIRDAEQAAAISNAAMRAAAELAAAARNAELALVGSKS